MIVPEGKTIVVTNASKGSICFGDLCYIDGYFSNWNDTYAICVRIKDGKFFVMEIAHLTVTVEKDK